MVNASLKLDEGLYGRIGRLADLRKRSAHSLMLEAVTEYVECAEIREAYLQEARESYQHYEDTGLHLAQEEMLSWLKKVASGERPPIPKCHR